MSKPDKDILRDFQWISEKASHEMPVFEETPLDNRTLGSVFIKKFSENALVPIGILATTACLMMGLASMFKGDKRQQQMFMRGRVAFQAFTFVAMGSGIFLTAMQGKKKTRQRQAHEEDLDKKTA